MKVTLKLGKKEQTVKVKTMEDVGKLSYILYGQILKQDMMPDIADDKFSCKLDGEKIEPKKLLVILKDKLKSSNSDVDKPKKKKKDKKQIVSTKKDKSNGKKNKLSDKKSKKKKKDKDKKKKKSTSLDFPKKSSEDGLIHLHRRNVIE